MAQDKPILNEKFADNGEHSHWELINDDGKIVWSEDKDTVNPKCGICGGKQTLIRGRYPKTEARFTCPTCTQERMDQINEISSPHYGKAAKAEPLTI